MKKPMKPIVFKADERTIRGARRKARRSQKTLSAYVRGLIEADLSEEPKKEQAA